MSYVCVKYTYIFMNILCKYNVIHLVYFYCMSLFLCISVTQCLCVFSGIVLTQCSTTVPVGRGQNFPVELGAEVKFQLYDGGVQTD